MPKINDHPLRLQRVRKGLSQAELARKAGVNRSTVQAIEENRTTSPSEETVRQLEQALDLRHRKLEMDLQEWQTRHAEQGPDLTPVAKAVLQQSPAHVAGYDSFVAWRRRIAPSATAFASMLGINRAIVSRYEEGIRVHGMPDALSHAIVARLGVSNQYLLALQKLEPNHEEKP